MNVTKVECEAKCCDGWTIDENGQCSVRMYLSFFCVFVKIRGCLIYIIFHHLFSNYMGYHPSFQKLFYSADGFIYFFIK
jgi:hypothetical protein